MTHPFTLHTGDALDILATLPAESCDAMLTDPPYGLGFMGRRWDHAVPSALVWAETLRVLRPGAYALVFGGTRTWHRLAVALEDAGFELRDTLMWLYGSGFPKSHDVSKAIDKAVGAEGKWVQEDHPGRPGARRAGGSNIGQTNHATEGNPDGLRHVYRSSSADAQRWNGYGTALKPAWEPVLLVRKPPVGPIARNVIEHGVGALNIDGTRIAFQGASDEAESKGKNRHGQFGTRHGGNTVYGDYGDDVRDDYDPPGRWPANVVLDPAAAEQLDASSGVTTSGAAGAKGASGFAAGYDGEYSVPYGDTGGASRFYYVAKAGRAERDAGLDHLEPFADPHKGDGVHRLCAGCGASIVHAHECTCDESVWVQPARRNHHPTVKPLDLNRYLAKLLLPPPRPAGPARTILVPFAGSGSEMIGALTAGWDHAVGIEKEPEYVTLAEARLKHHTAQGTLFGGML